MILTCPILVICYITFTLLHLILLNILIPKISLVSCLVLARGFQTCTLILLHWLTNKKILIFSAFRKISMMFAMVLLVPKIHHSDWIRIHITVSSRITTSILPSSLLRSPILVISESTQSKIHPGVSTISLYPQLCQWKLKLLRLITLI